MRFAGLGFTPSLLAVAGTSTSNLEMRGELKSLQGGYEKFRELNYLLSAASSAGFAQPSLTLCNISRVSAQSSRTLCLHLSRS